MPTSPPKVATGFTLVELLLVVVIIGVIAALVLVKFDGVRESAYQDAMLNDLRNFATAAEIHLQDTGAYPADPATLDGYALSDKVAVASYSQDTQSWDLTLERAGTDVTCTMRGGSIEGAGQATCADLPITVTDATPAPGDVVTFDANQAVADLAAAAFPGTPLYAASLDDLASIEWDFGDGTVVAGDPYTYVTWEHTFTAGGTFTVVLTLTKKNGKARKGTIDIVVGQPEAPANLAPNANFSWVPSQIEAGAQVDFTNASSDPEGGALTYVWDFGGLDTSTATDPSFTFPNAGDYAVSLEATDPEGLSHSLSQTLSVVAANLAPSAVFSVTTASPTAGEPVSFDASASSDDDGTIASYSWDFDNDGVEDATGATASHTFSSAATYPVTLTVTDDGGATGETSTDVTVEAAASFSTLGTWDACTSLLNGGGTTLKDISGGANHITVPYTPSWSAGPPASMNGSGVDNKYLSVPAGATSSSKDWAVLFLVQATGDDEDLFYATNSGGQGGAFAFRYRPISGYLKLNLRGNWLRISASNLNGWHVVAVRASWDGSQQTIDYWVDGDAGKHDSATLSASEAITPSGTVRIISDDGGVRLWGNLSQVKLIDGELTDAEVLSEATGMLSLTSTACSN